MPKSTTKIPPFIRVPETILKKRKRNLEQEAKRVTGIKKKTKRK